MVQDLSYDDTFTTHLQISHDPSRFGVELFLFYKSLRSYAIFSFINYIPLIQIALDTVVKTLDSKSSTSSVATVKI